MDDERQEELDCIAAIFPELVVDPNSPFSVSIEIPVHPTSPVKVIAPNTANAHLPTPPLSATSGQEEAHIVAEVENNVETHSLNYLPSLQLRITLPEGYPETHAPEFVLATTPEWLTRTALDELQEKGIEMWEEVGHSQVVFGYIDSLQQAAENAFGFAEVGRILDIPQDFKISLLDYDVKSTQAAFEKETFDCGVCLDPKKGTVCHRMIDCGHVFCVQCLQDFYNNAITEGNLVTVQCLAPGCSKKRADEQVAKGRRKAKTQLSPSELLQIPLEQEMVTRYVRLRHKADLESDKDTIYCPRKWCQGAARSKKHRKPAGFEDAESEDESDTEENKPKKFVAGKDLLSVCEDCSFAFCSRCYLGWHGEFSICIPRTDSGELTEEDKASLAYMKAHTSPCPYCASPSQKTYGCNHMICFKCSTHFCYLCSSWLNASNPYAHYNNDTSRCNGRLWELEEGEEAEFRRGGIPNDHEDEDDDDEHADDRPVMQANVEPVPIPEIVEPDEPVVPLEPLQREGPLVLRINHIPGPPPPPAPDAPDAVANPRRGPQNRAANVNNQRRVVRPRNAAARRAEEAGEREAEAERAAQQAWVQRFVQMAMNDEEDQLDSDDEEDAGAWEIPVR